MQQDYFNLEIVCALCAVITEKERGSADNRDGGGDLENGSNNPTTLKGFTFGLNGVHETRVS